MTSLNFPLVLLEKSDTIGVNMSIDNLCGKPFALINNQKELDNMATKFKEPVQCHYYSVVNKAIEINRLFS